MYVQIFRTATLGVALFSVGSLFAQDAQQRLAAAVMTAREETQNTRAQLQNTISTLNKLSTEPGDLRPNFEKYTDSVEKTRAAADLTRKRYDSMSADSKMYFDGWKSDLASISNPDIRKVSEKRMKAVMKDYNGVLAKLAAARQKFGPMMSDLDDFKTAMGNDLTPGGLKALSKSVKKTNKSLANGQAPVVNALLGFDALAAKLTPAR